jgi:hypothetical protein
MNEFCSVINCNMHFCNVEADVPIVATRSIDIVYSFEAKLVIRCIVI